MSYTDDRRDSPPEPSAPPMTPRTLAYYENFFITHPSAPELSDDGSNFDNEETPLVVDASAPPLSKKEQQEYFLLLMIRSVQQEQNNTPEKPEQFTALSGERILQDMRTRHDVELISLMTLQLRASGNKITKKHKRYQKTYNNLIQERNRLLDEVAQYLNNSDNLSQKKQQIKNKFEKLYRSTAKQLTGNDREEFNILAETHITCLERLLTRIPKESQTVQQTSASATSGWSVSDDPWYCWYAGYGSDYYYYDNFYYCEPLGIALMAGGIYELIELNAAAFHNTVRVANHLVSTLGPVMNSSIIDALGATKDIAHTTGNAIMQGASSAAALPNFTADCAQALAATTTHAINAGAGATSAISNFSGNAIDGAEGILGTIGGGILGTPGAIFGMLDCGGGDEGIILLAIGVIALVIVVAVVGLTASVVLGGAGTVITIATLRNLALHQEIKTQLNKLTTSAVGSVVGAAVSTVIGGGCGFGLAWAFGALGSALHGTQLAAAGAIIGTCGTHVGTIIGAVAGAAIGITSGIAIGGGIGAIVSATTAYVVSSFMRKRTWQLTNKQCKKLQTKDFDTAQIKEALIKLGEQYNSIEENNGVKACINPFTKSNRALNKILQTADKIKAGKIDSITIDNEKINLKQDRSLQFKTENGSALQALKKFATRKTTKLQQYKSHSQRSSTSSVMHSFRNTNRTTTTLTDPEPPQTPHSAYQASTLPLSSFSPFSNSTAENQPEKAPPLSTVTGYNL